MKIFYTASLRGAKEYISFYKEIFDVIHQLGHINLDEEIFKLSSKDYYEMIENKGRDAYVALYNRKISHIQNADLCIFEATLHSSSIGFEINKSLQMNKPTLVLYYDNNIPHFLAGIEDEKLLVKSYTKSNIYDIIKSSINELSQVRDKRFNFFISPNLLTYLKSASKKEGITKSTFIRNLIKAHKRQNAKN